LIIRSPRRRARGTSRGIRGTAVMECPRLPASVCLDAGEFDHLGPLFGFVGDQLSELSRRSRQRHAAEVSGTGGHLRVVERRVDLLVECVDDLGRRVPGCADPVPKTCLVPGTNSPTVGMFGSVSERVAVVTASARSLPVLIYSIDAAVVMKPTCTCPASRSTSAGPPPR